MKRKIRYQAKTDLKLLRRINGISKEYVADKIGYTIRSLERMEKENAVTTERTAHQLIVSIIFYMSGRWDCFKIVLQEM